MHSIRMTALLFSLLALCACTGTPQIKRYVLQADGDPVSTVRTTAHETLIGIGKIALPAYLDRHSIVHRQGSKILMDDYQLWAEPLTESVPRTLVADLSRALPAASVLQAPYPQQARPDWRVFVRIDRFEAVDNRAVEMDVRWSVIDKMGKTVLSKRVSLESLITDGRFAGDDLSDVVEAHKRVLAELAQHLAADLGGLPGR